MATSSTDSIFAIGTTQIAVPAGATNALLINGAAKQINYEFKWFSGGTLWFMGATLGQTLAASDLANAANHYLVPTGEIMKIAGPARFYLAATGATAVVMAWYGLSQG